MRITVRNKVDDLYYPTHATLNLSQSRRRAFAKHIEIGRLKKKRNTIHWRGNYLLMSRITAHVEKIISFTSYYTVILIKYYLTA